jgi:DNA-binding MarR family transcriptional regulator
VLENSDTPLSPEPLGRSLAEVFAVLGPLYRRAVRSVESAAATDGLSIGVRTVLELTQAAGPRPVPRIAETLALSRQFVQRMVDSALEQGLVELEPNPAHVRSPLVALTERGAERIAQVKNREHAALREVGGELTERDIDSCLKVLRHLLAVVDRPDDVAAEVRGAKSQGEHP